MQESNVGKYIAVVLSGTDGDGSLGLKAVKVAGGVTFAQCEATAKFNSMPNTAVATGNVDFVLPPQGIAKELTTLSRSPFLFDSQPFQTVKKLPEGGTALATIFAQLRTITGVDFNYYKPTTLNRRMQRRMLLYKLDRLEDYAQYLKEHPAEVQALYEEILIHVTSFFRDPEAFEQLKAQVFPTISQKKSSNAPIRIWVAGCSTGEEVYSLAICLLEFFSNQATLPPIQIFATDISETAISQARSGLYSETQMEGVSAERRNCFFVQMANGDYQISSTIRKLCIFARHNLGGDPPFSNLDLISCRNLLIYLSDSLQQRIMSLFHYSLNSTGFLMLGTSESVKTSSDLFTSVHEQFKIYVKKLILTRPLFSFTTSYYPNVSLHSPLRMSENIAKNYDLGREVDQLLSNRYAPVSVVVNDQMDILQLRGDTDLYLKLTPGTTDLNLLMMAREGLEIALHTAIYQAQTQNVPVRQEQIKIESDHRAIILNLEVIPFQPAIVKAVYFLVCFEAVLSPIIHLSPATGESREPTELEREIVQLRQTLTAATQRELSAQAHLQVVIQEQNYLNQSLQVANEEILSSNEELQSTNEELEIRVAERTEELVKANQQLLSEITERKRAELQLLRLAFHDALTGLPNRATFINRLQDAIDYSKRHSDFLFAVLFLDLDSFKSINDSFGHTFGDQLLLVVAQRLQKCLRSIDVAARIGGDEFTILLMGIKDVLEVVAVVERIQNQMALPVVIGKQEIFTTASIGIDLSITGCKEPEDFLRDADIAMYRAKTQGRACYKIFRTDMHIQAMAHLQLVNELHRAIELQEFLLYYQPIVSLQSGKITGFEALVRWLHPKHGIVLPEYFISSAQETGLIILIEQWVLHEACGQMQQWQQQFSSVRRDLGESPLTISVNLCSTRFSEEKLQQHMKQVLQSTGLHAPSLTLEITESVIMENNDLAIIRLKQLRNLGIQLAIDDFGTGYSSLGRLHDFPINQLKIDRSFVSGGIIDHESLDIVETIITLAHKLGVHVTAEGIETEEQLALLRKLNCEYGQGYFFSHPLDSSSAAALIMANPQW